MSSRTPNIDLVLPVGGEHVSRAIINENNTKIDTFAGSTSSSLNTLSEQIAQREIRLDLGTSTTSATPEAVLQESFASMSEQTTYTGKIRTTSVSWLYTGYKYSTNYGVFHVWTYNTSNAPKVIRNYNGSWSSEQLALKSDISSTSGGVPIRRAGAISNNSSFQVELSSDYSANEGFALVALNLSGNGYAGAALLFLGRGTEKKKDILGNMSTSSYSATYSNGVWTITNTSGSSMYYTVILSK